MEIVQLDGALLMPLELLSDQQAGMVIKALIKYIKTKEISSLADGQSNIAYNFLVEAANSFLSKQEEIRARRARGGNKGGRPPKNDKKNLNNLKVFNDPNSSKIPSKFPNSLINNKNIIKEEIINNEELTIQDNNINSILKEEKDSRLNKSAMQKEEIVFSDFVKFFNQKMKNQAIPKICSLTEQRKGALRARAREHGIDALKLVVDKAAASDFLNGKNQRGWIADFKWIFLHPNNFVAIMEGSYDNKPQYSRGSTDPDIKDGTRLRQDEMNYTEGLW